MALRAFLFILCFTTLALAAPRRVPARETLHLAFSAPGSRDELHTTARALERSLSKLLKRPVEATPFLDSKAAVEALVRGEAQLAWLPPWAWLEANDRAGAVPLVRSVRAGARHYRAVLYVRQDSPVQALKDLAERSVGWAGLDSTSGYIVPRRMLYGAGVTPKREAVLGDHARVCRAVWRRTIDAGATYSTGDGGRVDGCTRELGADAEKLRIVATSEPIPNDGIVAAASLPVTEREQVREAFLALAPGGEAGAVLQAFGVERFEAAAPAELGAVRALVTPADADP